MVWVRYNILGQVPATRSIRLLVLFELFGKSKELFFELCELIFLAYVNKSFFWLLLGFYVEEIQKILTFTYNKSRTI